MECALLQDTVRLTVFAFHLLVADPPLVIASETHSYCSTITEQCSAGMTTSTHLLGRNVAVRVDLERIIADCPLGQNRALRNVHHFP
jgi:hypothetical protein